MTHRPAYVRCACCGVDAHAKYARQAVLAWVRSAGGGGTMSDPQELFQTNVWIGQCCWGRKRFPIRSRELWVYLDRIAMTIRNLLEVWMPRLAGPRSLFDQEETRKGAG